MSGLIAAALGAALSLPPAAAAGPAAPAATAPAGDADAARRAWTPVLQSIGVTEGAVGAGAFARLVEKLATLPPICDKIRRSSPKPISLKDWVHVLRGLGIQPKPVMSEADWAAVLAQAGVDVSLGVSAPLPSKRETATVAPAVSSAAVAAASPAAAPPAPKAVVRVISADLKGMDIGEALKLIARQGEFSMVVPAGVHGSVSLLLKNVDVWDALREVLESADLAYAYDGQVVRVMTAAEYEKDFGARFDDKTVVDTLTLKNMKADAMARYLETFKSRLGKILTYDYSNTLVLIDTPEAIAKMKLMADAFDGRLETRVFTLNYAKAKDILAKIAPMTTKDVGSIQMDERTNRLFVVDYPSRVKEMAELVDAFDEQHRAVLIEARIVQITLSKGYQMGVNWGAVFSRIGSKAIPGGVTGNFAPFTIVAPGTPANGTSGPGAQGPTGLTAAVGTLTQNNYTAIVQALDSVGKTDLLSEPRVSVINNETADVLVGTKQAYVTDTVLTPGTGVATTSEQVNFIDVGVKLHVTPSIGDDGYITMKVKPEVSSVASNLVTAGGNTIPIVATTEAETTVLIKDGETILLGGLIEKDKTLTDGGVPLLSRIPLLGALFRSRNANNTKSEIAVFLTCRVQNPRAVAAVPGGLREAAQ